MPCAENPRPAGSPGLFEVSPLASLGGPLPGALPPYYSLVLATATGLSQLHFGAPGQLAQVLAQVPAHAQGQVLRFADDFLYGASPASEPLLRLFHEAPGTAPLLLTPEPAAEIAFLLTSMQQQAAATDHLR